MGAYLTHDKIEEQQNADEVIKMLREEKEAELSEWFAQSIKPRFIQSAVLLALSGKADISAVDNTFDVFAIEELTSEFIQTLADEIARQQMKINDKFTD